MSDPQPPPDAPPETFLSHLFELRTRLVRAIVAVVVVLFCLFPWAKDIYATLAAPLLQALPPDTQIPCISRLKSSISDFSVLGKETFSTV